MAGDWLPMRKSILKELEVLRIARLSGYSRRETFAILFEVWGWFDEVSEDGIVKGVTLDEMSKICPDVRTTFFDAMTRVGWLLVTDDYLQLPNFERWFGKSAKKRLKDARYRSYKRSAERNVENLSGFKNDKSTTREEKRREEKNKNPPNPPSRAGAPAPARAREAPPEVVSPGFAEFWDAYPRKTAKRAAIKVWNRLAPSDDLRARMAAALAEQKRSPQWTRDNGQFIPHAATWLNGQRWEDRAAEGLPFSGIRQWLEEEEERDGKS